MLRKQSFALGVAVVFVVMLFSVSPEGFDLQRHCLVGGMSSARQPGPNMVETESDTFVYGNERETCRAENEGKRRDA